MKREDISDAMAHIGDDLLEEADAVRGTGGAGRSRWKGWAALAACAGVVLFGAIRWGGGPGGAACQHQDGQGKGKGQFVDLLHVHHLYPIYKRNGKNVTQSGNFPRTGASQLSSNMP